MRREPYAAAGLGGRGYRALVTTDGGRLRILAAFAAIYLVWGSTFLAIRWAVETIPPFPMMPLRCLFALSGMGFVDPDGEVRVSATGAWLRLDAHYGAVVRRRTLTLPLLV